MNLENSALILTDHGFAVTLLEDACTTKDLNRNDQTLPAETVHQVFMAALNGMFAQVMTTNAFLVNQEPHP